MKKRYQVFISSTFQDLQPARQEVSQALLRSECFPAGMELFPAADTEQFAYIKEVIDESDYYIIISAGRYGSVDPNTGLSYTEMEYDYALERGKPIIRLLHSNPFNDLRGEFIEKADSGREKLSTFHSKLKKSKLVRFWRDPRELGAEVIHGIEDAKKRHPAQGWIRAQSSTPSYDELRDSIISMGDALRAGTDVVLDRFPYPVLRANKFGEIVYANFTARKISDGNFEVGRRLDYLFKDSATSLTQAFSSGGSIGNNRETVTANFGGVEKFFEISISRMDDLDGSLLAVLNDLTGLRKLEGQFVQSQKMQAIGQLAGGVAHDFNNLLTAISGHCDLLLLRHDEGDLDFSDLMQISQNANRAASLVGQLLAFSRKQTLRPQILDIRELLEDLSHLLNRLVGEKVDISYEIRTGVSHTRADRRQIEQVIMNLIVNARDAMPNGGGIQIGIESKVLLTPQVQGRATLPAGRYVRVTVVDEGIGIPEENLHRVFEPFFTTKKTGDGTGLGLSTAYGIVKQSGGFIFASSELGSGATFEILLPECRKEPEAVEPARDKAISSGSRKSFGTMKSFGTIVYAEDEAPVRAFTTTALRLRGFSVIEAVSGEDALKQLEEFHGVVDAFLTDVVMPGMDGPAWVIEASKNYPDVPVLFVSGYAKEGFWDKIEGLPNFRFLPKPYSLAGITQELASLIVDAQ